MKLVIVAMVLSLSAHAAPMKRKPSAASASSKDMPKFTCRGSGFGNALTFNAPNAETAVSLAQLTAYIVNENNGETMRGRYMDATEKNDVSCETAK